MDKFWRCEERHCGRVFVANDKDGYRCPTCGSDEQLFRYRAFQCRKCGTKAGQYKFFSADSWSDYDLNGNDERCLIEGYCPNSTCNSDLIDLSDLVEISPLEL